MAEIHTDATLTPGKRELIEEWMGAQRWYAAKGRRIEAAPSEQREEQHRLGQVVIQRIWFVRPRETCIQRQR